MASARTLTRYSLTTVAAKMIKKRVPDPPRDETDAEPSLRQNPINELESHSDTA